MAGAATAKPASSGGTAKPKVPAKEAPLPWEPGQIIRLELRRVDPEAAKEEGRFASMYGGFVEKAKAGRTQLVEEEEAMKVCTPFNSQADFMLGKGPRHYQHQWSCLLGFSYRALKEEWAQDSYG